MAISRTDESKIGGILLNRGFSHPAKSVFGYLKREQLERIKWFYQYYL